MDDDYTVINSLVAGGPAAKSKSISVGDRHRRRRAGAGKPMVDVIGWRLDDVALIKGKAARFDWKYRRLAAGRKSRYYHADA